MAVPQASSLVMGRSWLAPAAGQGETLLSCKESAWSDVLGRHPGLAGADPLHYQQQQEPAMFPQDKCNRETGHGLGSWGAFESPLLLLQPSPASAWLQRCPHSSGEPPWDTSTAVPARSREHVANHHQWMSLTCCSHLPRQCHRAAARLMALAAHQGCAQPCGAAAPEGPLQT